MQDRPSAPELLDAIERFLRGRSAASEDRWLRFQLLVCANSLAIVRREMEQEEGFVRAEWPVLDAILGAAKVPGTYGELLPAMSERHEQLCAMIRAGTFDDPEQERALLVYLVQETEHRVRITAPGEL